MRDVRRLLTLVAAVALTVVGFAAPAAADTAAASLAWSGPARLGVGGVPVEADLTVTVPADAGTTVLRWAWSYAGAHDDTTPSPQLTEQSGGAWTQVAGHYLTTRPVAGATTTVPLRLAAVPGLHGGGSGAVTTTVTLLPADASGTPTAGAAPLATATRTVTMTAPAMTMDWPATLRAGAATTMTVTYTNPSDSRYSLLGGSYFAVPGAGAWAAAADAPFHGLPANTLPALALGPHSSRSFLFRFTVQASVAPQEVTVTSGFVDAQGDATSSIGPTTATSVHVLAAARPAARPPSTLPFTGPRGDLLPVGLALLVAGGAGLALARHLSRAT